MEGGLGGGGKFNKDEHRQRNRKDGEGETNNRLAQLWQAVKENCDIFHSQLEPFGVEAGPTPEISRPRKRKRNY